MAELKWIHLKLSMAVGACLSGGFLLLLWWFFCADPREAEIRRLQEQIVRLETERRVAQVVVVEQRGGRTRFRFAETAPDRAPVSREFEIEGEVAYFDALVVRFDAAFTKLGDSTRGKSLYLFRRVFGEHQAPVKGFPLDPFDKLGVPAAYRLHQIPSAFEREIWRDFWDLALNPKVSGEKGIRVLQGQAVYTKLVPGKIYHLTIQDAGGLSIQVEEAPALNPPGFTGN